MAQTIKQHHAVIIDTLQNVDDEIVVTLLRAYIDGFIDNVSVDPFEIVEAPKADTDEEEGKYTEEVDEEATDEEPVEEPSIEEEVAVEDTVWFNNYVQALSGYWEVGMVIFHTDADHEPRWPGVVEAVKRYCCNIPDKRSKFKRWLNVIESARQNAEEITTLPSIKEGSILDNLMRGIVS